MAKYEKNPLTVSVTACLFYPITWLSARKRIRNKEKMPRTGGALLVMNHISHIDPPFDGTFVHSSGRVPRFMAKDSLFRVPFLGWLLRGSGAIPVYRGTSDARESLRAGFEALAKGWVVTIYPEGTVTRDPAGWPMKGKTGAARLALESEALIVPAARWGSRDVFNGYTKKYRPFPRKTVTTIIGDPIDMTPYRGKPVTAQLLREVTDVIMDRITDLLAEVRGEQRPAELYDQSSKSDQSAKKPGDSSKR